MLGAGQGLQNRVHAVAAARVGDGTLMFRRGERIAVRKPEVARGPNVAGEKVRGVRRTRNLEASVQGGHRADVRRERPRRGIGVTPAHAVADRPEESDRLSGRRVGFGEVDQRPGVGKDRRASLRRSRFFSTCVR